MKCNILKIALIFCLPLLLNGQTKEQRLSVRAGNINSGMPITSFPGLFYSHFHPTFDFGYSFPWIQKEKSALWVDMNVGYFYHRFVQHGIPATAALRYQYKVSERFEPFAALGGGYLHAIPAVDRFRLDENGEYEQIRSLGRPQACFYFSVGTQYNVSERMGLLLEYKMLFQTPFVRSYVPLLPYGMIQLGINYRLYE